MAEPRTLASPPISEALIDIRMIAPGPVDRGILEPLISQFRQRYPKVDEQREFTAEFKVEAGKMLPPSARELGFRAIRLTSEDGRRIVQLGTAGLTFNNVKEYIGGDQLIAEALNLWEPFAATTGASAVVRLGLRFINKLNLPFKTGDDLTRFLTKPGDVPSGVPDRISNFLTRVVSHDDETGAVVIVTQKLDTAGESELVPVILDIDVSLARAQETSRQGLLPLLASLRTLKNRCFFALLTEEAVSLYA